MHPTGQVYTAAPWSWCWEDIPFFPADFLFDDGSCGSRATPPGERFFVPDVIPEGERHDLLFKQLRSWKFIFEEDEARENIHLLNITRCKPPLPEDDDFERWFRRNWRRPDRPFKDDPFAIRLETF